jgi:His/Glu/Gln/Arg/opine family amino acid ABC transporter permease subunit
MSDVSYVRTEMLGEKEPPVSASGPIGWIRANLFSSWLNAILTIVSVVFIAFILEKFLAWAIAPTWYAASLGECRDILHVMGRDGHNAGACWGVIRDRWVQLIFGFYPSELYWRPILAFVLLFVAMAPVLFADKVPRKLIWFSAAYPFIFPWLLWGGNIWPPLLVAAGFILGYVVFKVLESRVGQLAGMIIGTIVALLWWLFAISPIDGALNNVVTNIRAESYSARMQADIDALQPEVAQLQKVVDTVGAEIKEQEDVKAKLITKYDAVAGEDGAGTNTPEARALASEYRAAVDTLAVPRAERDALGTELLKKKTALSTAIRIRNGIQELSQHEAEMAKLSAQAEAGRAKLPAALRNIHDLKNVDQLGGNVSAEDKAALDDILSTESKVIGRQNAISETHRVVGLFGLEPVVSRNFGGFMLSITIGVVAIAISLPLGILLALGRQSDLLIVRSLCIGFIEFIRGVPLITLLFVASVLLNIFMPPGTNFDIILRVMIMATLFSAAYMAEVVRGGLAALPKGQYEGADSLGLDYWQAQRLIIMPQALKISIPGIVSTFIGLYKDTTLVSIIGLLDPLGLSTAIRADTAWNGIVWELYGFIALLFWIGTFSMSRYSMYLERKLNTGHR